MIITLLNDLEDGTTDCVIISETTTSEKIQSAIFKVKEEKECDYQFDDLLNALPSDCKVYSRWGNQFGVAIY